MIKIITKNISPFTNFIDDALNDFWIDVKKHKHKHIEFEHFSDFQLKIMNIIYHLLDKFYLFSIPAFKKKSNTISFYLMLGPDFSKFLLARIRNEKIVPYMMDAWPMYHKRIERAIRLFNIETMFFSSKQVADIFSKKGLKNAIWLPEAIRIEKYYSVPFQNRTLDVLSFGRRWDWHHNAIVEFLKKENISYLYQKTPTTLLLPNWDIFISTLCNAKITICVPSNISHPEKSGDIETITWRYFQCMAAKTIIVGIAPKELISLFGYNPIIEIEQENPSEQVKNILNNLEEYNLLVNKNYNFVSEQTWSNRWISIENYLKQDK